MVRNVGYENVVQIYLDAIFYIQYSENIETEFESVITSEGFF